MYYFCTYFDHNYLSRGLVLYDSLNRHCKSFTLYVLALSSECQVILEKIALSNMIVIPLEQLEKNDPDLYMTKRNRSTVEYFFTLTPCFPNYLLNQNNDIDLITYLDSDLYFFSDPHPIFQEILKGSTVIVSHRYPRKIKNLEIFGKYNVGWLSFRNDEYGRRSLKWYRTQCLNWCFDRLEQDRFADQKYLEQFSLRFERVFELNHVGANLAPWNVDNYDIEKNGGLIYVDDTPLIFFHVQGLKKIAPFSYDSGLNRYKAKMTYPIRNSIYLPYLSELESVQSKYGLHCEGVSFNGIRDIFYNPMTLKSFIAKVPLFLRRIIRFILALKGGSVIFFRGATQQK